MFRGSELVYGRTEGVRSSFHVLRVRNFIRWHRGRWVSFSCFVRPDSFLAVPRASDPVFILCALGLFFGGVECVGSHFNVLRARTYFWRYRGRGVSFSCFVSPDLFSAVPTTSSPIFMLCAPELIFGGTEGVGSRFHVLRARTHFLRYRGRRVLF
jgi:hypothetical protein